MTLEATLDDLAALPAQTGIGRFVEQAALAVQTMAAALREQRAVDALPDLRAMQRTLVTQSTNAGDHATAELLARVSDRLVDNVNALAYAMKRSQAEAATTPR
jgi:hypothetical protein